MAVRNPVQQIAAAHKRVSLAQVAKFSKSACNHSCAHMWACKSRSTSHYGIVTRSDSQQITLQILLAKGLHMYTVQTCKYHPPWLLGPGHGRTCMAYQLHQNLFLDPGCSTAVMQPLPFLYVIPDHCIFGCNQVYSAQNGSTAFAKQKASQSLVQLKWPVPVGS